MRRTLFLFLSLSFCLFSLGQIKVAVLEPVAGDDSGVTSMEKAMVRGELRKAIFRLDGFEAISRSDLDQVFKEQDFQHMGYVPREQIHRMGQMSGADYLCISTLNKSASQFYIEAYLVNITSGEIESPASQFGEVKNGNMADLYAICQALIKELIGDKAIARNEDMEENFEQNTWGWTIFSHDAKSVMLANDELRLTNFSATGTTQSDVMMPVDITKNFKITFNIVIQESKMFSSAGIKFGGNNHLTVNSGTCSYRVGQASKTSSVAKIGLGRNRPVVIDLVKQNGRISLFVNGIQVCDEPCSLTTNQMSVFAGANTLAMLKKVTIHYTR